MCMSTCLCVIEYGLGTEATILILKCVKINGGCTSLDIPIMASFMSNGEALAQALRGREGRAEHTNQDVRTE